MRIELGLGHELEPCRALAARFHAQLSNGYTRGASVMPFPKVFSWWEDAHRTARRRAARARRLGYWFKAVDRQGLEDDVHAVNTSMPARQGRPMDAAYNVRPKYGPIPMTCPLHHVYSYAVFGPGAGLVAYTWTYRCGELFLISTILGHADHLAHDVMYLLMAGVIEAQAELGGVLFYNMHAGGTDGLRYFKERVGLEPWDVEWVVA